jgi:hypothetical protein
LTTYYKLQAQVKIPQGFSISTSGGKKKIKKSKNPDPSKISFHGTCLQLPL